MPDSETLCPFCRAPMSDDAARCSKCGTIMPWDLRIRVLHDEIKSRESSRLRATITLVEEAFDAFSQGKPISLSAIKGLLTAWFFPRAIIVIGSVIGGLILAVQTWILWNQTQFLALQSRAAQVEQSAILRDRISSNTTHLAALRRIIVLYEKPIPQNGCESEQCQASAIREIIEGITDEKPVLPDTEEKRFLLNLGQLLQTLADETRRTTFDPEDLDLRSDERGVSPTKKMVELYRAASRSCQSDPDLSAQLVSTAAIFVAIVENGWWLTEPLSNLNQFLEFGKRFPQTLQNTNMGLMQWQEALNNARILLESNSSMPVIRREDRRIPYYLPNVVKNIEQLRSKLLQDTQALSSICEARIRGDSDDLRELDTFQE